MGLSLTVEQLAWSFTQGDLPFLRIPSLFLTEGSLTAITGPSGSGKSTLLFLLAGLDSASSGTIHWGDFRFETARSADRDQWRRRNLGLVFQDFQLVPELTAIENVLLPLTFSQWSISAGERDRALDLLHRLGVARSSARTFTLSRGEMQRTALARALLSRPPVILADEPTASLDSDNEESVAVLLNDYCRQEGATVVVSTHQSALAEKADRRLRLDHGLLTEER